MTAATLDTPAAARSSYAAYWLPVVAALSFLLVRDGAVRLAGSELFPKPLDVSRGQDHPAVHRQRVPQTNQRRGVGRRRAGERPGPPAGVHLPGGRLRVADGAGERRLRPGLAPAAELDQIVAHHVKPVGPAGFEGADLRALSGGMWRERCRQTLARGGSFSPVAHAAEKHLLTARTNSLPCPTATLHPAFNLAADFESLGS